MNDIIVELIYDDFYRTLALNFISVILNFVSKKDGKGNGWLPYLFFSFFLAGPFSLIIFAGIAFTNFDTESIKTILIWSFKWIIYFGIMFTLQHIIICSIRNINKTLKIVVYFLIIIISLNVSLKIMLPYNKL